MSGIYTSIRERLWGWALNHDCPADVVVKVCGVKSAYAFNAGHDVIADLGANICIAGQVMSAMTFANGVLDGADPVFTGVTAGPTLQGLVYYLEWTGGTQLIVFINTASDGSLPQVISSTSFAIKLDAAGIARI